MLYSDAYRVEEHQDNDEPVEPLRLHSVPDPEPKPLFSSPEVCTLAGRTRLAFQKTCCDKTHVSDQTNLEITVDFAIEWPL